MIQVEPWTFSLFSSVWRCLAATACACLCLHLSSLLPLLPPSSLLPQPPLRHVCLVLTVVKVDAGRGVELPAVDLLEVTRLVSACRDWNGAASTPQQKSLLLEPPKC